MGVIAVNVEENICRSSLKEGKWRFVNKIVIMYLGCKVEVYYNEYRERELTMDTSAVAFSKPKHFT